VIEPGARAAAGATESGRVGVIGTEGTIRSRAYERAIRRLVPEANIFTRACPLFVSLAEEGWVEGKITRLVVGKYLESLHEEEIDTLVLGCTHYPLLKDPIAQVMGGGVRLIDSAEETARAVRDHLRENEMEVRSSGRPQRQFYVTDLPAKFRSVGRSFLGNSIGRARQVDI
jgi:glutamate racemase